MVSGLLMELDDHNCWTIAEAIGHRGPHRLQHLLSRAVWDDQQVADIAAAWAAGHLNDGDAVLIVDETADEKSSADCVGAARQYSGTVGGVALCRVAVTLTYATGRGHALIGRALYLPEGCAADEEHRELAGVPEEVLFATKPQLAGALLDRRHRYTGTLSFYRCWTPGPVPLSKLIAIAVARWRIEEDHQLSKQVAGLDAGQVIRWRS